LPINIREIDGCIIVNKKALSERDICTKFITPALCKAGWDEMTGFLEEVYFTAGRIYVRGRLTARGKAKKADYILYFNPISLSPHRSQG
jgi:type I restriction enzyme R subunit